MNPTLTLGLTYKRITTDFERLGDVTMTPENIAYHQDLQKSGIDYQKVLSVKEDADASS